MNSTLQLLAAAIHSAPSADNAQLWRIHWDQTTLSIAYDSERVAQLTFPPDNPATLISIGATLENFNQAAKAVGVKLKLEIPKELNQSNPIYYQTPIDSPLKTTHITKKSIPLFNRHTNRFAYKKTPLPHETTEVLNNLTQSSARITTYEQPSEIQKIAQIVRQASEIRFQTKEVHEWLGKSLRFGDKQNEDDGLDYRTLALPPGGKQFLRLIKSWNRMKILNKLGGYKLISIIDSVPVKQAPCLVAIIAPSDKDGILSAGQLMNRAWIELNNKGLAVHPYYVIPDQLHRLKANLIPDELRSQADLILESSKELFQLREGETLQMLLRVGYPKKEAIASKRIPLNKVCSGIPFE